MKKYSAAFILVQIVIVLLVSWLIAIGLAVLAFNENILVSSLKTWLPMTFPVLALFYFFLFSNPVNNLFAKKTMNKNLKSENFRKPYTIVNKDIGTVGYVFAIDEETGRVAYVSGQNPFKFQMANPEELTDVVSGYIRGPMSTTRYVYFQFRYNGKKMRIPTFTSGTNVVVTSNLVKEGLAKADRLKGIVLRYNQTVSK